MSIRLPKLILKTGTKNSAKIPLQLPFEHCPLVLVQYVSRFFQILSVFSKPIFKETYYLPLRCILDLLFSPALHTPSCWYSIQQNLGYNNCRAELGNRHIAIYFPQMITLQQAKQAFGDQSLLIDVEHQDQIW